MTAGIAGNNARLAGVSGVTLVGDEKFEDEDMQVGDDCEDCTDVSTQMPCICSLEGLSCR